MAKMHLVPIRRGYWGKNSGLPHTIPMKLSGTCGSVSVRLIPAPRGTGLVAAPASKKILAMAGLEVSSCVQQLMRPSGGPSRRGRETLSHNFARRTATLRRAATRAPLVILLQRSSTRCRPRTATCRPSYGSLRRVPESAFHFMDAEGRRESKISLTRRSLLRSSARRPSKNTPTSSPRRPNRPRPTLLIRHAS